MKFIDLYNKNKNLHPFTSRVKQFKTYCYLMKNNPRKYKIKWDINFSCFRFLENGTEQSSSQGKYSTMGDYER